MAYTMQGEYSTSAPTDCTIDGQCGKLQIDSSNNLKVVLQNFVGSSTTAHDAAASTATSSAINCTGYTSVRLLITITGSGEWAVALTGSATSGGTYVACYEGATAMSTTTSASVAVAWRGVPNYIKVVATENSGTATCTVTATPINVI